MLLVTSAGISSVTILFQDYGQQPKTQEGELKISAVFSVSGSPLGKGQDLGWMGINRHFLSYRWLGDIISHVIHRQD